MPIRHVDVFLPLNLALGVPIAVSLLSDGSAFLQVILRGMKILSCDFVDICNQENKMEK